MKRLMYLVVLMMMPGFMATLAGCSREEYAKEGEGVETLDPVKMEEAAAIPATPDG